MKQKKLTLIVTVIMFFSFVAISPAQAVIDPVSLAIVGFATLISLITADKVIENGKNDSMAKQAVPENKPESKLQATSNVIE